MKNYDEAIEDIKAAIKLNPQDKKLRTDFDNVKNEKKKHAMSQQNAMAKFFAEGIYTEKEVAKTKKVHDKLPEFDQENVQTFFDFEIGNKGDTMIKGRVVFELFTKQVPKTAENFRAICTGEKGSDYHYKGNVFHRVIKGFMAQGGDITAGNGTGGHSIYGDKFEDEQIWYPHTHGGVLSMANAGPNTNGSQFFICFTQTPHLDEKHTIFGRIIHNYSLIEVIENNESGAQDKPLKNVTVVDCGELKGDDKLTADKADFLESFNGVQMQTTDFHDPVNQLEKDGDSDPEEEEKE
jgi:cyclophilin family peptidyl-prolyl cis-trans isomerase